MLMPEQQNAEISSTRNNCLNVKASSLSTEQQLAVIYSYAISIPIGQISQMIVKNIFPALRTQTVVAQYIKNFNIDLVLQQPHHALNRSSAVFDTVNSLICELLTWYFGVGGTQLRSKAFFNHEKCILNRSQISQSYRNWINELSSGINDVLSNMHSSLSELVDSILSHCYWSKELEQLASNLDIYLRTTACNYGLVHYVAQMREVYMVSSYSFSINISPA